MITVLVILLTQMTFSQAKANNNKKKIKKVLNTFMECLVK